LPPERIAFMKTMIESRPKKSAGFTLIELVVAILVFALGIMGIMKMHSASVQSNNYSMQLTEALSIAEDQMEILRGMGFASNVMSVGAPHTQTINDSGNQVTRGIPYNISYTVTDPGNAVPTRNIALTVRWKEKTLDHRLDMNARWDELNAGQ
jgi:type IV pilus assembly protein PilV